MPYAPAYEITGDHPKVLAAHLDAAELDGWFTQTALPIAQTGFSGWLIEQAGYTPPAPPTTGTPTPTTGRLWPR